MVRFGRIKKKTKAEPAQDESRLSSAKSSSQEPYQEHDADTDITVPLPLSGPSPRKHIPRISLPHVDTTLLNMHQVNGLFDSKAPEEQNGSTVIESTGLLWQKN